MEPLNMEGMDVYFRLEWPYTGQFATKSFDSHAHKAYTNVRVQVPFVPL